MATTVIIPARNEEKTIGDIVRTFNQHAETYGNVFVGIDCETTDQTCTEAQKEGGVAIDTAVHGKGQVVWACVRAIDNVRQLTNRIILCDGDYTGLTTEHIEKIVRPQMGMTIGVPDFPACVAPEHVISAWPHVSGFRCLSWMTIPANVHGYLLETQLNQRAGKLQLPIRHLFMAGLKSPFQWPLSERRRQALEIDREWGMRNGVL